MSPDGIVLIKAHQLLSSLLKMPGQTDPSRPDRVQRYVPPKQPETSSADHINAIGMVCSLVGLLIKV